MLFRLISRTSFHIRTFPIAITPKPKINPKHDPPQFLLLLRPFSSNSNGSNNGGGGGNVPTSNQWKILNDTETSSSFDQIFTDGGDNRALSGIQGSGVGSVGGREEEESWLKSKEEADDDAFKGIERAEADGGGDGWLTAEGYKTWTLGTEEEEKDVFDVGDSGGGSSGIVGLENEEARLKEREKEAEEKKRLEAEEKQLTAVLKGSLPFLPVLASVEMLRSEELSQSAIVDVLCWFGN